VSYNVLRRRWHKVRAYLLKDFKHSASEFRASSGRILKFVHMVRESIKVVIKLVLLRRPNTDHPAFTLPVARDHQDRRRSWIGE